MGQIAEVLNKNFDIHAMPNQAEVDAKIQSKLDNLEKLFSEIEKPEFAPYIRFAEEWRKLDGALRALQVTLHQRLAETPVNKANELLRKMVKRT